MKPRINVTQPFLPPLEQFIPYLEQIWRSKILTNSGPLHMLLESRLCEYLGVEHISLFNNATIGLLAALRACDVSGEVITTPFSYIATSHSLVWSGLTPVFVDIAPGSLNIDTSKIEAAITKNTTAILAVHCYGFPCETLAIERIAKNHGLKVIYDAAHAFGVQDQGGSILRHGDLSVVSFHATKVFNTFEGGAIICPDKHSKDNVDRIRSFGQEGEFNVLSPGINGKLSEIHAAMGLLQLEYIEELIQKRKNIDEKYRELLDKKLGITCLNAFAKGRHNYAYFPILVDERFDLSRDGLYEKLKRSDVHPRKYFFPLITEFPMYGKYPSTKPENLPLATKFGKQILCLPIYPALELAEVEYIVSLM